MNVIDYDYEFAIVIVIVPTIAITDYDYPMPELGTLGSPERSGAWNTMAGSPGQSSGVCTVWPGLPWIDTGGTDGPVETLLKAVSHPGGALGVSTDVTAVTSC